ncbi:hypothetical protein DXG01_015148 [Tephrocybe rancida]|nr:hypothetical protein DXG01_015148 [Tephrocybe rancida]
MTRGRKAGQGPKGKGKGKVNKKDDKDKKDAAASSTQLAKQVDDEAWMAMADRNVLDSLEEGLNIIGLANKGSSTSALSSLIVDDVHSLLAPSAPSLGIPPITTFQFDDIFKIYLSDDNWMLDDEFCDLPSLQTVSDSSVDEDLHSTSGTNDYDPDSSDGSMPSLQPITDDSEAGNESEDVGSIEESKESESKILSDTESAVEDDTESTFPFEVIESEDAAHTCAFAAAALTKDSPDGLGSSLNIDLYDSGALHHMSGLRHHLTNFHTTPPKSITAWVICTSPYPMERATQLECCSMMSCTLC